jgi:hypothetical protein
MPPPSPALGLSAHASLMGQKGDDPAAGDSGDTTSQVVQDIVQDPVSGAGVQEEEGFLVGSVRSSWKKATRAGVTQRWCEPASLRWAAGMWARHLVTSTGLVVARIKAHVLHQLSATTMRLACSPRARQVRF